MADVRDQDYYLGPSADIDEHGYPEVSETKENERRDYWRDVDPGARAILCTLKGADVSGTYMESWTKYDYDEIWAILSDLSEGFSDPNPPE